jgi:hypothetical protein
MFEPEFRVVLFTRKIYAMGMLYLFTFTFVRDFIIFVCDLFLHTVQHFKISSCTVLQKRGAGIDQATVSEISNI